MLSKLRFATDVRREDQTERQLWKREAEALGETGAQAGAWPLGSTEQTRTDRQV